MDIPVHMKLSAIYSYKHRLFVGLFGHQIKGNVDAIAKKLSMTIGGNEFVTLIEPTRTYAQNWVEYIYAHVFMKEYQSS